MANASCEYLSASAVAKLLAVRQSKVLSWIRAGELRAADVSERPGHGRARWRIARADLNEFLASRQPKLPTKRQRRAKPKKPENWIEYV